MINKEQFERLVDYKTTTDPKAEVLLTLQKSLDGDIYATVVLGIYLADLADPDPIGAIEQALLFGIEIGYTAGKEEIENNV